VDADLLPRATEFAFHPEGATFGDKEVHYFTVTVARRPRDRWAVRWMNHTWNKVAQRWEYEPSEPEPEFFRECRFSLDEAVRIARAMPDGLTINGKTWLDFKAIHGRQVS
jgi:hypothetical protein